MTNIFSVDFPKSVLGFVVWLVTGIFALVPTPGLPLNTEKKIATPTPTNTANDPITIPAIIAPLLEFLQF